MSRPFWGITMGESGVDSGDDRLTPEHRAELARRDAELDADPQLALTWEQIRAGVEGGSPTGAVTGDG